MLEDIVCSPKFTVGKWGPTFDVVLAPLIETDQGDYITRDRVCAACPIVVPAVHASLIAMKEAKNAKEDVTALPIGRQGYTVHILCWPAAPGFGSFKYFAVLRNLQTVTS